MSGPAITTYLNDHLAGSVAAVELLSHLIETGEVDREILTELRREIEQDQNVLQELLKELGGKESAARKAAAWLTEKVGRAKLRIDESGSSGLGTLESLETLALGVQGKLSLWRALGAVGDRIPTVARLDLSELETRAMDQFSRIERLRLGAARRALAV